jgi:S-disulfanyl-L-cysteine oxidoreductase SoxD
MRRSSILPALAATAILIIGSTAAGAQSDSSRSTQAGVYTAAQAERGKETYLGMCASCHPAVTHTGVVFQRSWDGRPLSDLMNYMRENMPKNDPGTLSAKEYAQVLAYMLKLNGMPAGRAELTPDVAALRRIRIEVPGGAAKP